MYSPLLIGIPIVIVMLIILWYWLRGKKRRTPPSQ